MRTRLDQYKDFRRMMLSLGTFIDQWDIPVRDGEAHRTGKQAEENAEKGVGVKDSKHIYSLARDYWIVDIERPWDIVWINQESREPKVKQAQKWLEMMGAHWESIGGIWGGNFKNLYDPYHFEYGEKPL